MFLLVGDKRNFLVLAGILLIMSSLPFMFLKNVSTGNGNSSQVFSLFIEQSQSVFWWMFIIGLIVGGLGIGLRFWDFEEIKKMLERKKRKKKRK